MKMCKSEKLARRIEKAKREIDAIREKKIASQGDPKKRQDDNVVRFPARSD